MSITTREACPTCSALANCDHNSGTHVWDCPFCGEIVATVLYACPHCSDPIPEAAKSPVWREIRPGRFVRDVDPAMLKPSWSKRFGNWVRAVLRRKHA